MGHAALFKKFGQNGSWKSRLTLIEVAGQNVDWQKPAPLQFMQEIT